MQEPCHKVNLRCPMRGLIQGLKKLSGATHKHNRRLATDGRTSLDLLDPLSGGRASGGAWGLTQTTSE